ncbi:MAG: hypothetical protein LBM77_11145 [Spirochaetaceae bacterium]|jgi:hypothetical protein|nr:hypothetical protein [Spirochaetaceae bacterium]
MNITEQKRVSNAAKAKSAADKHFPNEKWIELEANIYLSPRRPIGAKSNFKYEKQDAIILKSYGSTVYLAPELRHSPEKKFDAIVDGLEVEFKNIGGNASTLQTQFINSRKQAQNVFINLETSNLTKSEVITALFGARNNPRYERKNKFEGGLVILKLNADEKLIFINVDDLHIQKRNKKNRSRGGR